MNKSKTLREYLDIRHPEMWEKLADETKEFLEMGEGAELYEVSQTYADSHRAAFMTPDGDAFYQEATNDEVQAARQKLNYGAPELNPYQLMCDHNYHILVERYVKAVRMDVETLQEVLDEDTWHDDTDLQKEIQQLRESSADLEATDDNTMIVSQLDEKADFLEEEADYWFDYIEQLAQQ